MRALEISYVKKSFGVEKIRRFCVRLIGVNMWEQLSHMTF